MKKTIILIALLLTLGCSSEAWKVKCCPGSCGTDVQVLAFTAEWCRSCKDVIPILLLIQTEKVEVKIVDIDRRPDIAKRFGITKVPTFIVWTKNGESKTHDVNIVVNIAKGWL